MTTETVNTEQVATVVSPAAIVAERLESIVRDETGAIRSKRDALQLAKQAGVPRRQVESALLSAWRDHATQVAEAGALELGRAARAGHKVTRTVSKTGRIVYGIAAKSMSDPKETASQKVARLEAEIAELKAASATK